MSLFCDRCNWLKSCLLTPQNRQTNYDCCFGGSSTGAVMTASMADYKRNSCSDWSLCPLPSLRWWIFVCGSPPHKSKKKNFRHFFFVGIYTFKTITKIKKQDEKLGVVSMWHILVRWLKFNKMKNAIECKTYFVNFTTNPICCLMTMSLCLN